MFHIFRHIKVSLSAGSVYYTGVKANLIKKIHGEFVMKPHSTEKLRMTVKADEYLEKLVEYCNMKLYAIATVTETRQTWADEDDFQVIKPSIKIDVPAEIPNKRNTLINLSFVNPLKKTLTKCKFNVSGPSLVRNQLIHYPDVAPGATVNVGVNITPRLEGDQKIVATFSSKELLDITGSAQVEVV